MSELSVIIPVRDDLRVIRCLRSIDDPRAVPLVALNEPTSAVRAAVDELGVASIELPTRGGPAACESAVHAATTRHCVFMDSDCVFRAGTLARLIELRSAAPLVRGRIVFAHYTRAQRATAAARTIHTNARGLTFKIPLMIDRECLPRLGGYIFDPRLEWTEDYDLSLRIRRSGLDVHRDRTAVVVHAPLSPWRDLRSGFAYGRGHRQGRVLGLDGYDAPRLPSVQSVRSASRTIGWPAAVHGWAFGAAITAGYVKEGALIRRSSR